MANTELGKAVEDAQRLLQYASIRGIELKEDLVSQIVDARSLIAVEENDPTSFDKQKEFWQAQTKLANATAPASIESIRFAAVERVTWPRALWTRFTGIATSARSAGQIALARANRIALFWLILVVVLTAYSETASTTLQSYSTNHVTYEKNQRRLAQEGAGALSPEEVSSVRLENQLIREQTGRQLQVMDRWLFWKHFSEQPGTQAYANAVQATTESMLILLRGSFLPVLWGVIGAALYVLRTLAQDLALMSYSDDHAALHRSRYYLGAVAGFVVAKFSSVLSGKLVDDAVQPLVLALLVGYSVDVLFNLLNKLIELFTPKN